MFDVIKELLDAEKNETSECQDWLVQNNSSYEEYYPEENISDKPYRLYRFLTDLEDILDNIPDDYDRIKAICPLVRKLLNSSYWLQLEYDPPCPDVGWSVKTLYQEPNYPITIQTVAWLPNHPSPIHNHAAWGVVGIIQGQEKNRFWRRNPTAENPEQVELINEKILVPGDIIGFMPDAIHSVETMGDYPTVTFNIYGEADFSRRYRFDSINHTAKNF